MLKDTYHDIVHQLSETMDSLWRMEEYIMNAQKENKPELAEFWKKFQTLLTEQAKILKEELERIVKI